MVHSLDELFSRYGTSLAEIEAFAVLDAWEVRTIENGKFKSLRLSSLEKIAYVLCQFDNDESLSPDAVIRDLLNFMI